MSILSDFEDRMGRALEGGFARVFRSPVQPAELARKLGKEMDRRKVLGVGKVYAPTLYSVLLSRQDDSSLGGFADTLAGELETYLVSYAAERNYELATRPIVRFLVDRDLKLGRFEVIGELLSPQEIAEEIGISIEPVEEERAPLAAGGIGAPLGASPLDVGALGAMPVATPSPHIFDADEADFDFGAPAVRGGAAAAAVPSEVPRATPVPALATVTVRGLDHDVVLSGDRAVVGRLGTCEIALTDVNVSREHAAFEREPDGFWAIRDLGSTNGTLIGGQKITRQRLRDGDTIIIGVTELVFHEPRG